MTSGSGLEARYEHAVPLHFRREALERTDRAADAAAGCARRSRRRWQIACGLAFLLAVASFALALAASVYEARGSVWIRSPEGDAVAPQPLGSALQAEVEILRSSEVLRPVLEGIGVGVLYPDLAGDPIGAPRAAAVERMRSALSASTQPGSGVIEVAFRHRDARLAAEVVNRLVDRFRTSRRSVLAPGTSAELLRARLEEQRAALAAAEAALAAFQTQHPQLAGDARRALAGRRAALERERRERGDALAGVGRAPGAADPSVTRARARLDELEVALQQTLNERVEGSRAVAQLRSEIALVREHLAQKEREAARVEERRRETLRAGLREVEARLAALAEAERELPELERRARELARDRDAAARRLEARQRALDAALVSAAAEKESIGVAARVLERAETPSRAIVPRAEARRAWALLVAALLVLLAALALDVLDRPREDREPTLWAAEVPAGTEGALALLAQSRPVPLERRGTSAAGAGGASPAA